MRYLKVAAASLNQIPLDWEHNTQNILQAIHKARQAKATVLCCPELCITGYGCEDMFLSAATGETALTVLKALAPLTKEMIVSVGLPLLHLEGLYNTACLMVDGEIAGFVAKQHLAGTGVYYEPRWFKAWPSHEQDHIVIEGKCYPVGDWVFDLNGLRLGFEICEDAWVAQRTGSNLAERGVDLILNPSASHFAFGKSKIRKRLVQEGARAFSVGYLYANLLGNESGRMIYDGDTLIAAGDNLLVCGPRFSFQDVVVSTAVLDIQDLRINRTTNAVYSENRDNEKKGVTYHAFRHFQITTKIEKNEDVVLTPLWEKSAELKKEEFTRSVALGLWDYLHKTKAFGFVLNLSGGVDSGASACLIYLMVCLSIQELGIEGFQKKLSYLFPNELLTNNPQAYLKKLLYCLYQKTENSSDKTWNSALLLSQSLGFSLFNLSVDPIVNAYCKLLEPVVNRTLNWAEDDITLQNIQARVRGPSAWMLANVYHMILLSTSNRSEAAVGYMTMDGDTCGGLSPLAGVDKLFIIQWALWLEKEGPLGLAPIKSLKSINEQTPTAELRPISKHQTDEVDLMPYVWLEAIERLFVRDKYSPKEILLFLQKKYPKEKSRNLATAIERFFVNWVKNQWKRERLAPSFHLDDESVDPKTWCRFPILSSGFKKELAAMWAYVNQIK